MNNDQKKRIKNFIDHFDDLGSWPLNIDIDFDHKCIEISGNWRTMRIYYHHIELEVG